MKYEQLAKDIIENVGGKDNVKSVVHCITRLRFKLHDESKANTDVLKNMEGVITVRQSGGQYQVVIGNHVPDVYSAVVQIGGFEQKAEASGDDSGEKLSLLDRFIDMIAGIFTPILGVLVATGMIKGFNALFLTIGVIEETSGTYQILNAVGDSLFYFLPVFLGYTSSKKFGLNPFVGMAIGTALVYPTLGGLTEGDPLYVLFEGTIIESPIHVTFLGIPIILMSYASSVIPIILAAFFGAKVEKALKNVIPSVVKAFLLPFFTLLIVVPLTFLIIGPIATWIGQFLGAGTMFVYDLSPIVAGVLIAGLWQILVMFGLHWGIVPIGINNLAVNGSDAILGMYFSASFAQIGAVLGVWMTTRKQTLKTLSPPAMISGIFGVTEPAIYGITLPLKRPFIMSCIAAGIGGGILGYFGSRIYMMGGLGIFGFINRINPEEGINMQFWGTVIATIVAFILGFIFTYFFGRVRQNEEATPVTEDEIQTKGKESNSVETSRVGETVFSPMNGRVISLPSIEDPAFSSEALGRGVAIEPFTGKLVSPVSGVVTVLFPTYHAVGIKTDQGAEVLMHIGMDTVQLEGQYFTGHVEQGQRVEQGQLLVEFDIEKIKDEGYSLVTPLVITNTDDYEEIIIAEENDVSEEQPLIILEAEVEEK